MIWGYGLKFALSGSGQTGCRSFHRMQAGRRPRLQTVRLAGVCHPQRGEQVGRFRTVQTTRWCFAVRSGVRPPVSCEIRRRSGSVRRPFASTGNVN